MKSNWNVRQTKKAIKNIASKLNDGDCACFAQGEFARIISHAPAGYVFVCNEYAALGGLSGWCMTVGIAPEDNGATIIGANGFKARYFGLDPYEVTTIRARTHRH